MPVLASARLFPIFKAPNNGGMALDLGLRWLYLVLNLQLQLERVGILFGQTAFLQKSTFLFFNLRESLYHVPLEEADSIVTPNKTPVELFPTRNP